LFHRYVRNLTSFCIALYSFACTCGIDNAYISLLNAYSLTIIVAAMWWSHLGLSLADYIFALLFCLVLQLDCGWLAEVGIVLLGKKCWFELTGVTLSSFLLLGITCSNSFIYQIQDDKQLKLKCSVNLWLLEHHVTVLCRVRAWVVPTLNLIRHCKEHKHYGMSGRWNRSCCLRFRFSRNAGSTNGAWVVMMLRCQ
jgi:hypothetical protein